MDEYIEQAEKFLKETGTKLSIKFKEFGHMDWDKEEWLRRNIFEVTLSNKKSSYTFDFGNSIADSCDKGQKLLSDGYFESGLILNGFEDRIEVFRIKWKIAYRDLHSFSKKHKSLTDLISESRIEKAVAEGRKTFVKGKAAWHKKKYYKPCPQYALEAYEKDAEKAIDISIAKAKIKKMIDKEIEELKDSIDYINKQKKPIEDPTSYDILASMSMSYCDDFADFASNFGYELKTAEQIRAAERTWKVVQELDRALDEMFTEEEIEMLHEIS